MKDEIKKACEVLQKGGVILYTTDTVWGIGCGATSEGGFLCTGCAFRSMGLD